MDRASHH